MEEDPGAKILDMRRRQLAGETFSIEELRAALAAARLMRSSASDNARKGSARRKATSGPIDLNDLIPGGIGE